MNKKENKNLTYAEIKKIQALKDTKRYKDKYFEYYDDVKSHTHKVVDW